MEPYTYTDIEAHQLFGSGGPVKGSGSAEVFNLTSTNGTYQFHGYGEWGNDTFNMIFSNITGFSHGHHIFGDLPGNATFSDTYNFQNINQVKTGGIIVGRLDDFDASRDTLSIEGYDITLSQLQSGSGTTGDYSWRVVEYDADIRDSVADTQQWLLIDTGQGYVFYALEGARVTNGDGASNDRTDDGIVNGAQEAHFIGTQGGHQVTASELAGLATVGYVDPINYVPSGFNALLGGVTYNDLDKTQDDVTNVIGDDSVEASSFGDVIAAGLNDDTVTSGGGNDTVWGGSGHDSILGESGNDSLLGGNGKDTIFGGSNEDHLLGERGQDSLDGGSGNDTLNGGIGNDTLKGGTGSDTFEFLSGDGTDRIKDFDFSSDTITINGVTVDPSYGGSAYLPSQVGSHVHIGYGSDLIILENVSLSAWQNLPTGDDIVQGTAGSDSIGLGYLDGDGDTFDGSGQLIEAGLGDDTMFGSTGVDTFNGGGGYDTVDYSGSTTGGVSVNMGETGYGGIADDDEYFSIEEVVGTGSNDTILGYQNAAVELHGGAGADSLRGSDVDGSALFGESGDDTLIARKGDTVLNGGAGDDSLRGNHGDDTLMGGANEDILEGQKGNDLIFGDAGDDSIEGGDGNDSIEGGDGADSISGDVGNDWLYGESGNDTITGGAGNDRLWGLSDEDSLDGGAGNDILYGGDGNDTLNGGTNEDRLQGGDDNDLLYGGNGHDTLMGEAGNDTLEGGAGTDTLQGGANEDYLDGGAHNDLLEGQNGHDTLIGGVGNDTLTGGGGADQFVFADGHGADVITDFDANRASEKIDLSAVTAITDLTDLLANHMTQVGSDVVITDGSNTITIEGVSLADMSNGDDFLF